MFNSIFKIVYFIEYILIGVIRKVYTKKYARMNAIKERKNLVEIILLSLNGIAMIIPLVYVFSPVLDFANYKLHDSVAWAGSIIMLFAAWILWRSHADLGSNWTFTVSVREKHTLVTSGIFKYIRHPMYAAHLIWAIAQIMMLNNWIAGYSFIIVMIPLYLSRVNKEEQMMIDEFGDEYRNYIKKTGRLIPKN